MKKWNLDELNAALASHGLVISEIKDIQHGKQLCLSEGTKVNWYSSGKVVVQGKDSDEKRLALSVVNEGVINEKATASVEHPATPTTAAVQEPKVFVVYGHDTEARDQLELMLLRMNIKPVILGNLAPDGKTIIEALIQTQMFLMPSCC